VVGQLADPGAVLAECPQEIVASSRLTVQQLAQLEHAGDGLQLLDVRGPGETASGTLPGATTIPLAVLADELDQLDPDRPVVVYCASGYRSLIAASLLSSAGFSDVSDLLGGYAAWENSGLPSVG
jgi:rhodanese-related sulfurtransferase